MQRRVLVFLSPVVIAVLQRRVARDVRLDRQRPSQKRPVLNNLTVQELLHHILAVHVPHIGVCHFGQRAHRRRGQAARLILRDVLHDVAQDAFHVVVAAEQRAEPGKERVVKQLVARFERRTVEQRSDQRRNVHVVAHLFKRPCDLRADVQGPARRLRKVKRDFPVAQLEICAVTPALCLADYAQLFVFLVLASGLNRAEAGQQRADDGQAGSRQAAPEVHHKLSLVKVRAAAALAVP